MSAVAKPRIIVLFNAFASPKHAGESLRSLAGQSFADWQVVILGPGTGELEELRGRVRHLQADAGLSPGAWFNLGISASESDLITCLSAGETWDPRFLELMERALRGKREGGFGAVACQAAVSQDDALIPDASFRGVSIRALMKSPMIAPNAFMWRRDCHEDVGFFNEALAGTEHWDFHLRLACKHEIAVVGEVLAWRRPAEIADKQAAASHFDDQAREYLEIDSSRTALFQHLGEMERHLERRLTLLHQTIKGLDRRISATSEKVGLIDVRTRDLKASRKRKR